MDRVGLARGAAACLIVVLAACGDDDDAAAPLLLDVPETVAIGVLPDEPSDAPTLPTPPPPPTTAPPSTTSPPVSDEPLGIPVGEHVRGNRILLIGDSVLASAAPRNEGLMCDALKLFGWAAELDAEPGRDIEFATEVLDERLPDGGEDDWDAILLSFGSEVDGTDPDAVAAFQAELDMVIERVAPRPVMIFTLADIGTERNAINEMIRGLPDTHPNAVVVEFADAGSDGVPVVDEEGRTLTDDGMKRLSIRTAAAVGKAPVDTEGECLPSQYLDDSGAG